MGTVVKRSIVLAGHKTSVSLEDAFWVGLQEIAASRRTTRTDLIAEIDAHREAANLSSATRLFVLEFYRERAARRADEPAGAASAGAAPH
jgi:predicted DNA-binding ribbon-helix-helix protein